GRLARCDPLPIDGPAPVPRRRCADRDLLAAPCQPSGAFRAALCGGAADGAVGSRGHRRPALGVARPDVAQGGADDPGVRVGVRRPVAPGRSRRPVAILSPMPMPESVLWQTLSPAPAVPHPKELPERVDAAVVGGGYT